jgi:phosphoenolpyruvate carboxykinase (GTP)
LAYSAGYFYFLKGEAADMSYEVKNEQLKQWVAEMAEMCQPDSIHWCDGSQEEYDKLCAQMVSS